MNRIILSLIFFPIIAIGSVKNTDKTLADFTEMCANSNDKELREIYCKLADEHRKSVKIVKSFDKNK